jgi:hypothetical protein
MKIRQLLLMQVEPFIKLPTEIEGEACNYSEMLSVYDPSWDDSRYVTIIKAKLHAGDHITQKEFSFLCHLLSEDQNS